MKARYLAALSFLSPFTAFADPIGDTLASSTPLFQETTGFDILGIASSTVKGLLSVVAGNGLEPVFELRGWIIGATIIGAVIFFTTRALRLSRNI